MRYRGTFRRETDGFGFLIRAKDANGNPPPNLPTIKGENEVGIFVSASMARRSLKIRGLILGTMDGKEFMFSIADSMTCPGKQEAYGLTPLNPSTV